jgi:hypothetical protein
MIATTRYKTRNADLLSILEKNNAGKHAALTAKDLDPRNATQVKVAADALDCRDHANAAWKKIPPLRRSLAETSFRIAENAAKAALDLGDNYSGGTFQSIVWGEVASAATIRSRGDQYSSRCTWNKTNATHRVTLHADGIPAMVDNPAICAASHADGLPLIGLYRIPKFSDVWKATWVANGRGGKSIESTNGWIAYDQSHNISYHSTVSAKDAALGLATKRDAQIRAVAERNAQLRAAAVARKEERRIRLVARLCQGLKATVKDAQSIGYCAPGIAAFKARYGIGDIASLPELVRTGDPSAIKLALIIARKATPGSGSRTRSHAKSSKAA